jgi:tRNA threonylcarbamoyladenosine biosynthesis protein TsaB
VAAAVGPGSFTGLRVGLTTAKTFAYAVGAKILGVSTLETIAFAAPLASGVICPVIDAQRKQLFTARFERLTSGELHCLEGARMQSTDDWLAGLAAGTTVTGPGLSLVSGRMPSDIDMADERFWLPTAEHVALLAWRDHQSGRRDDLWRLSPAYVRESAAEEKAGKRTGDREQGTGDRHRK